MGTIRYRGTRQQFMADIQRLVAGLTGQGPDPGGVVRGLQLRMAVQLMSKVKDAFRVASEGGTNELGIRWPVLSPATLALRRINTGPKAMKRLQEKFQRMSPAEQSKVREQQRRLVGVISQQNAQDVRQALRILRTRERAGTITRTQAAATRKRLEGRLTASQADKQAFAGAFAMILRDTGRFFNSFSPAIGGGEGIVDTGPGFIRVGSNVRAKNGVPLATLHGSDRPRRQKRDGTPKLPRRQIFPDDQHPMPATWWRELTRMLYSGLANRALWLSATEGRAS